MSCKGAEAFYGADQCWDELVKTSPGLARVEWVQVSYEERAKVDPVVRGAMEIVFVDEEKHGLNEARENCEMINKHRLFADGEQKSRPGWLCQLGRCMK